MPVCPCGVVTHNPGAAVAHDKVCGLPPKPDAVRKRKQRDRIRAMQDSPRDSEAWRNQAECANGNYPQEWWFPTGDDQARGRPENIADDTRRALDVCNGKDGQAPCPVRAECRAWALALGPQQLGVAGGLTFRQRQQRKWRPDTYPAVVVQPQSPVSETDRALQIIRAVADEHKVSVDELVGHGRERWVVGPRHAAMVAVRTQTGLSLPQIGRLFGGRHHTTVMDAIRSVRVPS
jgi:hypothetical protein